MKRILQRTLGLTIFLLFVVSIGWGQILSFEFSGLAGDETSAASNYNDVSLTSSTITRGAGLNASGNSDRFNATNWALTSIENAVAGDDYMEFTITPNSGCQFNVSSIYIQLERSSTGPSGIALRSSIDSYSSNLDIEYSIADVTSSQNFTFTFSQVNSGSAVTYRIYMWAESTAGSGGIGDAAGNDIVVNGEIILAEPTNHPSFLSAFANGSYQIDLDWNDNDGNQAASGFLIVGKTASASFYIPVDGSEPSDDLDWSDDEFEVKISHGTESYSVTGLSASTIYDFKIYAYSNQGANIDFKTDGSIISASATTGIPPISPTAGDLIITELVGDAAETGTDNGYFEIYNKTSYSISLDNVTARYYNSNPGDPDQSVSLSGSIAPGDFIIVTQNVTNFNSQYSPVTSDFSGSLFYFNGGDDGVDVYHATNGIIDQFNDNGSGQSAWNWDDSFVYERTNSGSGATEANWTAYQLGTGTPKSLLPVSWTGSTNNEWHTVSNWDKIIPGAYQNVTVLSSLTNYPTLSTTGSCYNITIQSGASLVGVDNLTVNGTATVEQEISAYSTSSNGWNLISCPMSNTDVATSNWVSGTYDMYRFDELTNIWLNQENVANSALFGNYVPGIGYLYANSATVTNSFTGTFNSSDVTISGLTKTTGQGEGWHVLGNPFPSAIDWATGWTLTNVGSSAQILKADGTGYRVLAANNDIPANQGFWVQVSSGTGSVTIPVAKCVHSMQAYSTKSTPINDLTLRLFLDSTRNVEHRIMFKPNATDNFDWEYDAHYLPPWGADVPKLFSKIGTDEYLALNAFNFTGNKSIPLGIEVQTAMNLLLLADGIQSFANDVSIILEDSYNTMFYDLGQQNPVTISLLPADAFGRYILHFSTVTEVDESSTPGIEVYAYDNSIYLNPGNFTSGNAYVQVFNTLGQEIFQLSTTLSGLTKIPVNLPPANYFVRINTGQKLFSEKLFIQ
ncbi:MAG: lamin tail domain-containing protein [Bacteroidales bacterium]|nr:lamin tail domain-containing protein [Bacteroidales bacterium]MCF8458661.1 lamin tail domain-containing protein [Bacteroidales bacterium]